MNCVPFGWNSVVTNFTLGASTCKVFRCQYMILPSCQQCMGTRHLSFPTHLHSSGSSLAGATGPSPAMPRLKVRTPFADPAQAPGSEPPSPSIALSGGASSPAADADADATLSPTGSGSYCTPVATPSAGAPWLAASANSTFLTPQSLVSAVSGTSWMSAADTLPTPALMHASEASLSDAGLAGGATSAPRLPPPWLSEAEGPPSSQPSWKQPRAALPAVIVEIDDMHVHTAAGTSHAAVAVHIQDVSAWEAAALVSADGSVGSGLGAPGGSAAVFRGPRGTQIFHSTSQRASWPPRSAHGPGSVAAALSGSASVAGSDRGGSGAVPGSFWPLHTPSRPSSGVLPRHDSLPRSSRRSGHLSRSASLSLLQVQTRPASFSAAGMDSPPYGPRPLISISKCMDPMRTEVEVAPLNVTATPRLVEFAAKCAGPFARLLPTPAPPTALLLPPACALAVAADAAAETANPCQTVKIRLRALDVGIVLHASGEDASAPITPWVFVEDLMITQGSVCDPSRIARLRGDLEFAHACAALARWSGSGSVSADSGASLPGGVSSAGDGLAAVMWMHAGAERAVRLPHAALESALTVPMNVLVTEVAVGMHERTSEAAEDEGGDWYMPGSMLDAASLSPLLAVSSVQVTACMPVAAFAAVEADIGVKGIRGTLMQQDVQRALHVVGAAEKLAPGGGAGGVREQQRVPWLHVRGQVEDVWLRAAGTSAEEACIDAALGRVRCSYHTPGPAAEPGLGNACAACVLRVSDLSVTQVTGKLAGVFPDVIAPTGIRTVALRALAVRLAVDTTVRRVWQAVGEALGLRVTADPPAATQSGFWDAAAGADVCVIGAAVSHRDDEHAAPPVLGVGVDGGESVIRFAYSMHQGTRVSGQGSISGAHVDAIAGNPVTSVLLCNLRVSTLFLAEIAALGSMNGSSNDGADVPDKPKATPPTAEGAAPDACVSVDIVCCELAAPAPAGPPGDVRAPEGGEATLRLGRVRVVSHPGCMREDAAAAAAAVGAMRTCVRQAECLRDTPSEELVPGGLQSCPGGAFCVLTPKLCNFCCPF